jgi:hypothetical protein
MCRKLTRWSVLLVWLLLCRAALPAQTGTVGQTFSSLLFLDGKNLIENKEVELGLDELLNFTAYDLQPNSTLAIKVTGVGFKTFQSDLPTNARGEVKTTLFFPKARTRLTCNVRFMTRNGVEEQVRFYLKPI